MIGRLEFTELVPKDEVGRSLFLISVVGVIIAVIVQPTVGSISDYTISRWGRRKPYIFIGSILDVVFLVAIANSNTLLAIAAFIALFQFSSNFAQGPFRGMCPISCPPPRWLRERTRRPDAGHGQRVRVRHRRDRHRHEQLRPRAVALGVLELATMLSVVIRVREGPKAKSRRVGPGSRSRPRHGALIPPRAQLPVAGDSRLAILMAGSC